jgi:RNA polymerase sigma-70 factor (ECF subfamily)
VAGADLPSPPLVRSLPSPQEQYRAFFAAAVAGPRHVVTVAQQVPAARLADHVDRMFRAAYALTGGARHDAEDLVQETFARVLARPRAIRHREDPRYLMRALRNTWIDMQRARAARPVSAGPDALEWVVDGSRDPGGGLLDVHAAYGAMHELSPKLREAIVAVDVLGLSYREAARALRIRQGTLQSRVSRARDHVAAALSVDEEAA